LHFRKELEELEELLLSPLAALSKNSRGRERFEEPCDVRTAFQRDRDRIVHSKSFRRLKHKTQVFIAPEGDHYRTRLTHTIEVSQVARTAARALRLNEDLTEAIALGHDLGHTPFGHAGEESLAELFPGGFKHNEQSLRVVDHLEGDEGLNLTWEVRDGILNHTGPGVPSTLEGQLVKICDRMAYINHDIDDALRGGILKFEQLPAKETAYLGTTGSERLNTMIRDLIKNSWGRPRISMSENLSAVMENLRNFLFKNVYIGSAAKKEERKARFIIKMLYNYWLEKPQELPFEVRRQFEKYGIERSICDYIAGMTDRYIITIFQELFVPKPWKN
jgi:dGTPase